MFLTPLSEALRRRLTAGAMALAINTLIVTGLIFMPRPDAIPPEPDVLDIVFVTDPVIEPEPEPEPVTEPDPEPVSEIEDAVEPDAAPEVSPETTPEPVANPAAEHLAEVSPEPAGGDEAPNILSDTNPFNDDRAAIPFPGGGGGTEYAVRSVFCQSTSDANRRALACTPFMASDGLPMLQYASEENIARGRAAMAQMTAEQIQALFARNGFPGRDLGGQPTLADPSARFTSSADQMRDTLPPLVPDPAFGD
ncbi:hypothetical protein [uncultured Maricaulis sp.]|uniref:hypothetical protein n=1 Tax=uncultured Maricaulis sp. TaxID=174710 RepID=UPI0026250007|nr:hypothetical protein [uncultured Maricaulis sp.]